MKQSYTSRPLAVLFGACAALATLPAAAYVGPGAGLSLIGALWAVIAAVGAALFFILMWPVRRMLKRRKLAAQQQAAGAPAAAAADGPQPKRS